MIFIWLLIIAVGMVWIIWGANRLVDGSAAVASYYNVSPLLIGMVVVGFGTSTPEMFISGVAAYNGNPGIALGNAYGSNISNIALIIGVATFLNPMKVHSKVVKKELPLLVLVTIVAGVLLLDFKIDYLDSIIFVTMFTAIMGWSIYQGRNKEADALYINEQEELAEVELPIRTAWAWLIAGFISLLISSELLVTGAAQIARDLGVDELIIGLTIIAFGTSLPELFTTISAAKKNHHDLALGTVVGSNLFNTLVVVPIAAFVRPFEINPDVLYRDWPVMMLLTLYLYFISSNSSKKSGYISKSPHGILLLICYLVYNSYLIYITVTASAY